MGSPGLSWAQRCLSFQESAPFAVIGSNTVVEAKGQRVRGRLYPWGIVEGKHGAWEHWEEGQAGMGQRQTGISNRDDRGELALSVPPLVHGRGQGRVERSTGTGSGGLCYWEYIYSPPIAV